MIEIRNTYVSGFEAAIRGMRNPKESWPKSDSHWTENPDCKAPCNYVVGPHDLALMKNLVKAGNDHSKFMRMINVSCDIVAPVYWAQELDTYKVGTVRNSSSLMHRGMMHDYSIEDFSTNVDEDSNEAVDSAMCETWDSMVKVINSLVCMYRETHDEKYFFMARALMPMGYEYRFTWAANYQVLRNIYHARKDHRLSEWHQFCDWIKTLPYSELITDE